MLSSRSAGAFILLQSGERECKYEGERMSTFLFNDHMEGKKIDLFSSSREKKPVKLTVTSILKPK
jgi:hypothetical protein